MRVAIVHDWLTGMRGGERVLEVLLELYPDAPVYTLFYDPERVSRIIKQRVIKTSFLQKMPFSKRFYRKYLPLFPVAVEQFDMRGYDLILSSSHCVAKGVIAGVETFHVCYCYTPLRYGWDMYHEYFGRDKLGTFEKFVIWPAMNYLRLWDVTSSNRVDCFVAISNTVRRRIEKFYRRQADVIYPPVDTSFFVPGTSQDEYFLLVSAFVPYKRVDLVVEAFNRLGLPLKVVGGGPLRNKLRGMARKNIEFLAEVSNNRLLELYQRSRALVFAGIEDFGLSPVEAQSAGRPVIAYRAGGLTESVIDGKTGVFFNQQNSSSLVEAVKSFHRMTFDSGLIRNHALQFSVDVFRKKIKDFIEKRYLEWNQKRRGAYSLSS